MYRTRYFEDDYMDPVKIKDYEKSQTLMSIGDLRAHQIYREEVYEDDLPSKVDAVGYVEPNKRIKQMQEAGWRIDAWNHAVYDFEHGIDEDDGYSMAAERNDWDDLDMLSEAEREKEAYFSEAYRMYMRAMKAQSGVDSKASEEKKVESVENDVVEKATT